MIKGMDIETARRYIRTMEKIDKLADKIYALASMMSVLSDIDEDAVDIKPAAVGYFGQTIARDVARIIECLDNDFASGMEIRLELESIGNGDEQI
jgi:hypothetical protein